MEEHQAKLPEKIGLTEINSYLTCYLCKGYLIDATTISECLHSFCRSCIIKFLQDNSYCPVCEVIINKAKPNLKLDKTLQDIVYKLVPELFLHEMTRRKQFYQQYPQIASRLAPEERGEDTERTIFNPQDCISLSIEYVSTDSTPGAIHLPDCKVNDKVIQLTSEENQKLMKRYLQCPGMCRVEVLKKFVRNKYNVDTSEFHIDILYKRVPLPDHYTLIDIAYIYSWKRNEPMKFFFRITDINKLSERFDYFDSQSIADPVVRTPVKTPRNVGERSCNRRRESLKKKAKGSKQPNSPTAGVENRSENEVDSEIATPKAGSACGGGKTVGEGKTSGESEISRDNDGTSVINSDVDEVTKVSDRSDEKNTSNNDNVGQPVSNVAEQKTVSVKPSEPETRLQNPKSDKNSVYTNITLNRTNNIEIITKIQKVSNKDGQPIGLNIIKQTVKSNNKNVTCVKVDKSVSPKVNSIISRPSTSSQGEKDQVVNKPNGSINSVPKPKTSSSNIVNKKPQSEDDVNKIKFLESLKLTAVSSPTKVAEKKSVVPVTNCQKRKNSSPQKNEQSKKPRLDKKSIKKIILHSKPNPAVPSTSSQLENSGLKSLIENCKIPSSLSITIKDGTENSRSSSMIPPVKNFIEILKLPDENDKTPDNSTVPFGMAESEQQVDEDLSEIAKSLTEKIPISTTISQIVGPKPQFPIPIQTNVPTKPIQPSPVPELSTKILLPKENKLHPRSPQTFQRIFEESIKKPDEEKEEQKSALDLTNDAPATPTGACPETATKKTKFDGGSVECITPKPIPKVPIPRLPSRTATQRVLKQPQKNLKFEIADTMKYQQTLANLHSNALGLNYTISVGPKGVASPKSETADVPTPASADLKPVVPQKPSPIPRNLSPGMGYSPRNSPKHSPKSSPMIKHMYAPVPGQPYNQSIPSPNKPLRVPSPAAASGASNASPLSPNQILEKYNIQNLAQLTANLNFNAAGFGVNPNNQLAAIQHAMLLKHFEMQNRQNWLSMNQGPLVQYEKYLQSLKGGQSHLLSNISKEN